MVTFKDYVNESQFKREVETAVYGLIVLDEAKYSLFESQENDSEYITEGVNDILKKFGLEFEKNSPGVIDYVVKFTKGVGRFILAAIKGDKKKMKELLKSVSKEEVLDFLLKLDMLTLHHITGPIHAIDALTGWELWANIEKVAKKSEVVINNIKKILNNLKDKVKTFVAPKLQPVVIGKITDIEQLAQLD